VTEGRHRATDLEIETRRAHVVRLRFARLSEPEIAEKLSVSPSTVSRDLQAIHENWGQRFQANFDAVRELAEAVALFELLEGAAVKELVRLETEGSSGAAATMRCILTAASMRAQRINLLLTAGVIAESAVRPRSALPRAAEIKAAIESARLEPCEIVRNAEPAWRPRGGEVCVIAVEPDCTDAC
jgi:predicted transcriptional regulator